MTGIQQIVVAMKPLEGNFAKNALEHGVAGINVDGCRVWTENNIGRPQGNDMRGGAYFGSTKKSTLITESHPAGRWPANLVLGHMEGCRKTGVKQVKGNPHLGQKNPETTKQYGGGSFGGGRVEPGSGYATEDGTETVDAWECAPGCPVSEIDRQSEIRGKVAGSAALGGASRYFKTTWEYDGTGSCN